MTIFEDVLRQLLITTNLCGSRVFLIHGPQVPATSMQTPYIVFLNVGPVPLHAHSGPLDVIQREYQISIFDTSQSRALGIADALREALDGATGEYLGVTFGAILYRAQTSAYEATTELHHIVTSFEFLYRITGTLPAFQTLKNKRHQTVVQTE